jgi:hypothetical protein
MRPDVAENTTHDKAAGDNSRAVYPIFQGTAPAISHTQQFLLRNSAASQAMHGA